MIIFPDQSFLLSSFHLEIIFPNSPKKGTEEKKKKKIPSLNILGTNFPNSLSTSLWYSRRITKILKNLRTALVSFPTGSRFLIPGFKGGY